LQVDEETSALSNLPEVFFLGFLPFPFPFGRLVSTACAYPSLSAVPPLFSFSVIRFPSAFLIPGGSFTTSPFFSLGGLFLSNFWFPGSTFSSSSTHGPVWFFFQKKWPYFHNDSYSF